MNRGLGFLAFLLWVLLGAVPASAHLTPNSEVRLTFEANRVVADIVIPRSEFAYATGLATDGSPASLRAAESYLGRNIRVFAPDGRQWRVAIERADFVTLAGPPDLHAIARMIPPPGAPLHQFALEWHAVTREVPTHLALVVEGGNLSGRDEDGRVLVGALSAANPVLQVNRQSGALTGFGASIALGARHIAEGYDHVLFLLALLLSAPLMASSGRWRERRDTRSTIRHLALIVTGFTLGHSCTLIAATVFGAKLPTAPVEVAIAVSVLVSAIHALRPIFPAREPLVATLFGLVHGLAFATLVSDLGIGPGNRLVALLGFNLGIEAMQLLIVVLALPATLWLAADPARARWRSTLALTFAAAAVVWLAERLGAAGFEAGAVLANIMPWFMGILGLGSLVAGVAAIPGLSRRRATLARS
jgi:hypothetical protein